jgi:hypothetical protein
MLRVLPLLVLLLLLPVRSFAQFYGAAGLGVTSSSNVTGLDSAIPDVIIDPSLILGYDWNLDHRFRLGLTTGLSLSQYTSNTDRSSTTYFFGVTPTYYFLSSGTFFATVTNKDTSDVESSTKVESVSDRLVKLENWIITVKPKLPRMKNTLDSAQELVGVTRELLSTTSYTTSVKEIVLDELRQQLAAIERHRSLELANITREWKALIAKLESIEEESDFLPTDELDIESDEEDEEIAEIIKPSVQLAPLTTLSTTHQRFRSMGASDFYLLQDRGNMTERTIATTFSLPISWTRQINSETYENYSNDQLWLSLRGSGMPSEKSQFAGSFDRITTRHPLDTVYSNTEWRIRGAGKVALSDKTLFAGEIGYGLRTYSNPLYIEISPENSPRKSYVSVGSEFSQVNIGAWFQSFISETLVWGGIVTAGISPDLKAYVTTVDRSDIGQGPPAGSLGVADEEYNYDQISITAFLNSNPIEEIEATVDLSYQHRAYGAVDLGTARTQAGNAIIQRLIASAANAERTENWIIARLGASRLFLFEDRFLSIFSGIGVDASVTYNSVSASVSTYTYDNTSLSLSAAAYF